MLLSDGLHLGYCTNIHPGESWSETLDALERYTLEVRRRVAPDERFGIGLRLSHPASVELIEPATLADFRRWLDRNDCYVFTINGFPYGRFHGGRVKEEVFRPDWTSPERLEYTHRLFAILAQILPDGMEGSVSTLPGSFKSFITDAAGRREIRANLWKCLDAIDKLSESSGHDLHLGLEPEPMGLFENTAETVEFFDELRSDRPGDRRIERRIGVNYDTCHLAVEFEQAASGLQALLQAGIRLSKLHFSSALRLHPTPQALQRLESFREPIYLHQVLIKLETGALLRFPDIDPALEWARTAASPGVEWRVHFHVPLPWPGDDTFRNTTDNLRETLRFWRSAPQICSHAEIETYTWEVLPPDLQPPSVVDQIVGEYAWCRENFQAALS